MQVATEQLSSGDNSTATELDFVFFARLVLLGLCALVGIREACMRWMEKMRDEISLASSGCASQKGPFLALLPHVAPSINKGRSPIKNQGQGQNAAPLAFVVVVTSLL